jgi:hypothetical protein
MEKTGRRWKDKRKTEFNPSNADLNPICHLVTLLGAHHILRVSRIGLTPYDGRVWTGLMWLKIGASGWLL